MPGNDEDKRASEKGTGGRERWDCRLACRQGREARPWMLLASGRTGPQAAGAKALGTAEGEQDSQRGECHREDRKEEDMMVRAREATQATPLDSILSKVGRVWKVLSTGGKQVDLHFQRSLGCWGRAGWRGPRHSNVWVRAHLTQVAAEEGVSVVDFAYVLR